jgi:hypothetical protein
MNIISASVSGEAVKKIRSKLSLAKTLGVPARRISSGFSIRTKILHTQSHPTCIRKGKLDQTCYLTRTENLHMTSGTLLKTFTQQETKTRGSGEPVSLT